MTRDDSSANWAFRWNPSRGNAYRDALAVRTLERGARGLARVYIHFLMRNRR